MKEASGELNMTLITIIAIAAIATLFATVFLPMIKDSITNKWNNNEDYSYVVENNNKLI